MPVNKSPHLHIAIPAMDELNWLPRTLESAAAQITTHPFTLYVCVNQPDAWWDDTGKVSVCRNNAALLNLLTEFGRIHPELNLVVLDRSSKGKGWTGKNFGVGWARKVLFDHILSIADDNDLLISMDADTDFGNGYFESVATNFANHGQWHAISTPYYHRLPRGDEAAGRAILHYEIYMRNFALNMLEIDSPYAFTAMGSAIAARVSALRKIGGITPMKSGEDFYLLQKLRKMGEIGTWNSECVYPAARFSDRVSFGTGPAIIRGNKGDWSSYPIYHHRLFQKIAETYRQLELLYREDVETEFLEFLQMQFKEKDLWRSIRQNVKEPSQFVRAFHEKADGLRILQFLRWEQNRENTPDVSVLTDNLELFLAKEESENILPYCSSYESLSQMPLETLSAIRDIMFRAEMRKRKKMA